MFPCCYPERKPGPTNELTENPQEAAKTWPETTWHGFCVHEVIYKLIIDYIEPILEKNGYQFQEVYLAYLDPFNCGDEDNGFIVGWDIWIDESDENKKMFTSAYCQFDIDDNGGELRIRNLENIEIEGVGKCSGFYNHTNGGRKMLHENWGGIVELRLD